MFPLFFVFKTSLVKHTVTFPMHAEASIQIRVRSGVLLGPPSSFNGYNYCG